MDVSKLLDDKRIINMLRLIHVYLHEIEMKESQYLNNSESSDTKEKVSVKDEVTFVLRDSLGNIKQTQNG